jgi:hypothetical protein
MNVSAYTPGDYRMFYDDPRTRTKYAEWAPFCLAAEDYAAGKVKKLSDKSDEEDDVVWDGDVPTTPDSDDGDDDDSDSVDDNEDEK